MQFLVNVAKESGSFALVAVLVLIVAVISSDDIYRVIDLCCCRLIKPDYDAYCTIESGLNEIKFRSPP